MRRLCSVGSAAARSTLTLSVIYMVKMVTSGALAGVTVPDEVVQYRETELSLCK